MDLRKKKDPIFGLSYEHSNANFRMEMLIIQLIEFQILFNPYLVSTIVREAFRYLLEKIMFVVSLRYLRSWMLVLWFGKEYARTYCSKSSCGNVSNGFPKLIL